MLAKNEDTPLSVRGVDVNPLYAVCDLGVVLDMKQTTKTHV